MDDQSLQETFPEAWRKFWKKRALCWLSTAFFIFGIFAVFRVWPIPARSWIALVLVGVLFSVWGYALGEFMNFVCPRCHKFFFIPRFWPGFLQSSCAHCGLAKYGPSAGLTNR
jgi:hypothetical protein